MLTVANAVCIYSLYIKRKLVTKTQLVMKSFVSGQVDVAIGVLLKLVAWQPIPATPIYYVICVLHQMMRHDFNITCLNKLSCTLCWGTEERKKVRYKQTRWNLIRPVCTGLIIGNRTVWPQGYSIIFLFSDILLT